MEFRSAGQLRLYDNDNSDYVEILQSTTDSVMRPNSSSNTMKFTGWNAFQVQDGAKFRVYNSADTDYMEMDHDGTDFNINGVNTTEFDIATEGFNRINLGGSTNAMRLSGDRSMNWHSTEATVKGHTSLSLGDDSTDTFNVVTTDNFIIVLSNNADSDYALLAQDSTALVNIASGSRVAVGTSGSNPNTDTKSNYWMSSTNILSIKNRTGGTLHYTVYSFSVI